MYSGILLRFNLNFPNDLCCWPFFVYLLICQVYITMLNNWILGLISEIQLLGPWYLLYIYVFKFGKGQWTWIQPQLVQLSSIQLLSCVQIYDPMDCSMPVLLVHHQLPKLTQTHVHWVGDAIQPSHTLASPSPPAFNLSQHQGLFQWVRWPKYWSFSFSISPSNVYSELISFRMDWFGLLAAHG